MSVVDQGRYRQIYDQNGCFVGLIDQEEQAEGSGYRIVRDDSNTDGVGSGAVLGLTNGVYFIYVDSSVDQLLDSQLGFRVSRLYESTEEEVSEEERPEHCIEEDSVSTRIAMRSFFGFEQDYDSNIGFMERALMAIEFGDAEWE